MFPLATQIFSFQLKQFCDSCSSLGLICIHLGFQVIEGGGEMDITFQVTSPRGLILVNDEKKTDEVHTVTTPHSGVHSFCFDNSFSTLAEKIVYVDLDLSNTDEESWVKTLGDSDLKDKDLQIDSIRVCILK